MEKYIRPGVFALSFIVSMMLIVAISTFKIDTLTQSIAERPAGYIPAKVKEAQLKCLTQNIYYEAGHESFEGKVAVAQVTMNRLESGRFADTVCGVVQQKNVFYQKVVCQFSWYCDDASKRKPINPAAYNESFEVAKMVLLENFRLSTVKEAIYYHADYVNPQWGKPKVAVIGRHIFYKESPKYAKL